MSCGTIVGKVPKTFTFLTTRRARGFTRAGGPPGILGFHLGGTWFEGLGFPLLDVIEPRHGSDIVSEHASWEIEAQAWFCKYHSKRDDQRVGSRWAGGAGW